MAYSRDALNKEKRETRETVKRNQRETRKREERDGDMADDLTQTNEMASKRQREQEKDEAMAFGLT